MISFQNPILLVCSTGFLLQLISSQWTGALKGSDLLWDSFWRSDQLLRETSVEDQWNHVSSDFIGLQDWFPAATDLIMGLSKGGSGPKHSKECTFSCCTDDRI